MIQKFVKPHNVTGLIEQIVPQCDSIEVAPFVLDILFFYCWWCYNKSQSILFPDGIVRFDVESDFLNKQTILENRILLLGANLPPLRFVLCDTILMWLHFLCFKSFLMPPNSQYLGFRYFVLKSKPGHTYMQGLSQEFETEGATCYIE